MSSYKPYVCMMPDSTCYKNTEKMQVKGVLWHSTGANNPTIRRYVQPASNDPNYSEIIAKIGKNNNGNDWEHATKNAGLNAWIGKYKDGTVGTVQAMPWNYRPWGCGTRYENGPSCNDGWVQFEICEDFLIEIRKNVWVHKKDTPGDKEYAQLVWDEAVKFTAYICTLYGLDPKGTVKKKDVNGKMVDVPVITCHHDAWKLGFGSGHGDINHWFPIILGKDMSDAREEVAKIMGDDPKPVPPTPKPTPTPVPPFKVRIKYTDLNIRKGPGTNYDRVRFIEPGAYTIVEVSDGKGSKTGWGKLKSGIGWISLDYVTII